MARGFEADTRVDQLDAGRFEARLDRGFWIQRGPNGGYVAAILLRAAIRAVDDPARTPRSLTVHFLAPPREGPVEIATRIERSGRSLTSVSARLLQDGRVTALALAALGRSRGGPTFDATRMPEVPPPERCAPLALEADAPPMRARYECRPVLGASASGPGRGGASGGFIRLAEPCVADAPAITAFADAWVPAVYEWSGVALGRRGVPTIDLTVHFRTALPLPGARPDDFYLAVFRTRLVRDGFLEEDGEIYARDGTLLAHSRQLAVTLPDAAGPGTR